MNRLIPAPTHFISLRLAHIELPPYRYVPGLLPHPLRSPEGHLYQKDVCYPSSERWWEDHYLLRGADLFDHRFYWEAHEVWEERWHQVSSEYRTFLQALIQMAAAILKHHLGHKRPCARLWGSVHDKMNRLPHSFGLNWMETQLLIEEYFAGGEWPVLVGLRGKV
ncbi:MAG: DUF309 domain-containing protein [Myxococcota bacterium]|nr:DUF309 domain-containing protein [Myxococcota bacterium]